MRILVIGSGAREHAIVLGLAKENTTGTIHHIHVAPGNAGMGTIATCHPEAGAVDDAQAMLTLAQEVQAELVVIGPEVPLVAGVADELRAAGIPVFGPSAAAAQLEGSKAFAKEIMRAAGVKTAQSRSLDPGASASEIDEVLDQFGPMWVVKDDGLAAGKGVVVTEDRDAAKAHAQAVLDAGNPVLCETYLDGPEVSLFCLVDGETVVPLLPAQDHKRAYDNDQGPNTGGMGAYAPVPWLPDNGVEQIVQEVCEPVAKEMVARGTPYSGLLYAGLAWGKEGPAVVEFNCRFGDPETQAVLALLNTPLAEVLNAVAQSRLAELPPLQWAEGSAITVVLAAQGYPASPKKGDVIDGLDEVAAAGDVELLHAGTKLNSENKFISDGGRVLNVVAQAEDLSAARDKAYEALTKIHLAGGHYRKDIALAAVEGRITCHN
ncbi:phosphoribosylamine--glycine ligase [Corynebacterium poyangense]|uniref:Phosphoribosylamine--glycine ligase n=1 Tax=Corynebacterium poyangense TaxID=2684405 RepID=A0A7H0SQZ8_9CORY|nr:phosphoribosylamine--glycine ligase [Corynebacterium poyangense]QNQ90973.1 phosphoribosylamine--glycine ligase [Corynebacterium poyangense]